MINFLLCFVAGVFIGYSFSWLEKLSEEKCPRVIRGYNCKGDGCDHSKGAVAEAEWDMRG